ncbi:MAG TPA: 4a-hydroxytetrahydrobiopterin dehydratase [Dehalococcoidia bacterium]|nr:4a-hydroxytetrahydrobiopterin dehydratase [Dehalococcoidia bacterium]
MAELLSDDAIQDRLRSVPGWSRDGRSIRRRFELRDFKQALEFVNRVADRAEAADHHPDIAINWNKVTLELSTHAAGGLTEKDFRLAGEINALV